MDALKLVFKWIFGIGCVIFGLLAFSTTVFGAILFLIAGVFLIPPLFNKINHKGKIKRLPKIITPIIAVFTAILVIGSSVAEKDGRSLGESQEKEITDVSQEQETQVSPEQKLKETSFQKNDAKEESSNTSTTESNVVKTFSGSGGKNTRPFMVNRNWEIQWEAKGDMFQLYLYDAEGEIIGVPANQQGSGKGNSYQAIGGEYYLQVNALGDWIIEIVQLSSAIDSNTQSIKGNEDIKYIASFEGSGGKNTRPFTVPSGWEIQWDAKGDMFQLYLYTAEGEIIGVPANQQGSGTGNSYQAKGGEYYLHVNALGDWTIKIAKVE